MDFEKDEKLLHTNLSKANTAKYAFIPGSPQRVERIAKYLDNPEFVTVNREHETWCGYLEGQKVLVTSSGMGGPSTAIAEEELARIGVTTFIRVGSCASTSDETVMGDVVIPSACVRMEGTGLHYAPLEYPATPNIEVFDALREASRVKGFPTKIGTVISRDGFFTQYEDSNKPYSYELANKWKAYKMMGALATEMEAATLFIVGASLGLRTGGVLVCATNNKKTNTKCGSYPISYEPRAIEVAVDAMRRLIRADNSK